MYFLIIVSIKESEHLSSNVSVPSFFVGEDANVCCEDEAAKLSSREDVIGPLFELLQGDIVAR